MLKNKVPKTYLTYINKLKATYYWKFIWSLVHGGSHRSIGDQYANHKMTRKHWRICIELLELLLLSCSFFPMHSICFSKHPSKLLMRQVCFALTLSYSAWVRPFLITNYAQNLPLPNGEYSWVFTQIWIQRTSLLIR